MTQIGEIIRSSGVGSSEIPIILGLSPFKAPMDLYLEKRGEKERDEPDDLMMLGLMLQEPLAKFFTWKTGIENEWFDQTVYHSDRPWQRCRPDALIPKVETRQSILEIKTANLSQMRHWGRDDSAGEDSIPDYYAAQAFWQMSVTGLKTCYVGAYIAGSRFSVYKLHWQPEFEAPMVEAGERFWRQTLAGQPPEIDGSKAAREYLQLRFPRETEQIRICNDAELKLLTEYGDLRALLKRGQAKRDLLENQIIQAIGDAAGLEWPHGKFTWKCTKDVSKIKWEALAKSELALQDANLAAAKIGQYTKKEPGSRRIYWKDNRQAEEDDE
jgi:putative phage-type endonuclease